VLKQIDMFVKTTCLLGQHARRDNRCVTQSTLNTNVTNYMHSIACRIINTSRHLNTGNTNYIHTQFLENHLDLAESLHLDEIVLIVSVCDDRKSLNTYVGTFLLQ
jgi:hypothetical protein